MIWSIRCITSNLPVRCSKSMSVRPEPARSFRRSTSRMIPMRWSSSLSKASVSRKKYYKKTKKASMLSFMAITILIPFLTITSLNRITLNSLKSMTACKIMSRKSVSNFTCIPSFRKWMASLRRPKWSRQPIRWVIGPLPSPTIFVCRASMKRR